MKKKSIKYYFKLSLKIFVIISVIFTLYCLYLFFSFNPHRFSQNVSQDSKYYDPFAVRYSKSVVDRNGDLLSVFLNETQQWHLNDNGNEIPQKIKISVLTYEDKHFYSHFGIDFLAIIRTIKNNLTHTARAGASTLSMQVVKLLQNNKRTYFNKFKESIFALRLESLYSKDSILQMYLNNAPYGGNIVGFKSACLLYFEKLPSELTWAESALLAVLPNAPGLINLSKNRERLLKKRNALLQRLYENGNINSTLLSLSLKEPLPSVNYHKNIAPHLSLRLINEDKKNKITLKSSIDKRTQVAFERKIKEYGEVLKRKGVMNIAALLLDSKNGETLAYIGSQDFLDIESFGQIDGIRAMRRPGSLLKPLLYAFSIDNGLIAPDSMLLDVPLFFSNFNPQNATHSYYGLVSAKDSLIKSLNVPFVNLLQEYGATKFFFNLQEIIGFKDSNPSRYGLSLILGTKEMSVENIAKMYLMLANYGELKSVCYAIPCFSEVMESSLDSIESKANFIESKNKKLISSGATFLTLQALKELKRDGVENLHKDKKIISWKSGTSFGQKDAWAAGVTPVYTLVVWIGNFTGKSSAELLGVNDAGSIFFELLGLLDSVNSEFVSPNDFREVSIETLTGYALSPEFSEYNLPSKSILLPMESKMLKPSPFLKKVWLDAKNNEVDSTNPSFANARPSVRFNLPLSVLNYYKLQNVNIYSHIKDSTKTLKIIYPMQDLKIIQANDLNKRQNLVIRIANLKKQKVFWYMDGEFLGEFYEDSKSLNLGLGTHTLIIIGTDGSKDSITFHIDG